MFQKLEKLRNDGNYHPPTKLQEGNVFTGISHSVQGGGVGNITCIMGYMVGYPPTHQTQGTPLPLDIRPGTTLSLATAIW